VARGAPTTSPCARGRACAVRTCGGARRAVAPRALDLRRRVTTRQAGTRAPAAPAGARGGGAGGAVGERERGRGASRLQRLPSSQGTQAQRTVPEIRPYQTQTRHQQTQARSFLPLRAVRSPRCSCSTKARSPRTPFADSRKVDGGRTAVGVTVLPTPRAGDRSRTAPRSFSRPTGNILCGFRRWPDVRLTTKTPLPRHPCALPSLVQPGHVSSQGRSRSPICHGHGDAFTTATARGPGRRPAPSPLPAA